MRTKSTDKHITDMQIANGLIAVLEEMKKRISGDDLTPQKFFDEFDLLRKELAEVRAELADTKDMCMAITESCASLGLDNEKLEAELAAAMEEIINYRIEAKRLVDSTLGLELTSDNRKLKSARASLQKYLSTPSSADKVQAVLEFVDIMLGNAEIVPDPRMGGSTDCYLVPLDDIESLRALREKG